MTIYQLVLVLGAVDITGYVLMMRVAFVMGAPQ